MTQEQKNENETIETINYTLNQILLTQKEIHHVLRTEKFTNVLKHHQAMLNLDYAYEITQRAIEMLTAAKNK